jgi:hypothetical protein
MWGTEHPAYLLHECIVSYEMVNKSTTPTFRVDRGPYYLTIGIPEDQTLCRSRLEGSFRFCFQEPGDRILICFFLPDKD